MIATKHLSTTLAVCMSRSKNRIRKVLLYDSGMHANKDFNNYITVCLVF